MVEEKVLSQLKNSISFVYSMSHGNEPRGQPSQSMPTPLTLEEKVDALAMCMGLITQAIIDQQTGPPTAVVVHHTVVDEDEEMGDFEDEVEEGEEVGSGVAESGTACFVRIAMTTQCCTGK
jgi:hypothetical protein